MPRRKRDLGVDLTRRRDALHYHPQNVNTMGHSLPNRHAETRQVDSWRSYRNDSANLQTSTVGYPSSSRPVVPDDIRNFAPLRESAPRSRRQGPPQQAQNSLTLASGRTSPRYNLRSRHPDQIAQYSNAASADVALPSIETPEATTTAPRSSRNVPPLRLSDRRSRTSTPGRVVDPPPAPKPSAAYVRAAREPPALRAKPQKLLVILDLNGTLLVRPRSRADPTKFKLRPGVMPLLNYLFENHVVMVYSSARPENATAIVNKLIHPRQRAQLAAVWARDKLGLSSLQYNNKVQVYKKLNKIWADPSIQAKAEQGGKWNQSNTVLVDDSHLKGLAEPHNLLQVPEFENNAPHDGGAALRDWQLKEQEILKSLEQKLEELKWQVDVSRLIREWQTGKRHAPGIVDETIDQKTHRSIQQPSTGSTPAAPEHSQSSAQLLTPRSPPPSGSDDSGDEPDTGDMGVRLNGKSSLDNLEKEVDRQLSLHNVKIPGLRRSESPVDESVWRDLLGGKNEKEQKRDGKKGSGLRDVPSTPDSIP